MAAIQPKKVFIIIISVLILFVLLVIGPGLANIFLKQGANVILKKELKDMSFDVTASKEEPGAESPEYAEGELIVFFKKEAKKSEIENFLKTNDLAVKEENKDLGFSVLSIQNNKDPKKLSSQIKSSSVLESIEPNYIFSADWAPDDLGYKYQWNLGSNKQGGIGMEEAWDFGIIGEKEITVAVLDTGIAPNEKDYNPPERLHNWRIGGSSFPTGGDGFIWELAPKGVNLGFPNVYPRKTNYFKDYLRNYFDLTKINQEEIEDNKTRIILNFDYVSSLEPNDNYNKVFFEISPDGENWEILRTYEKEEGINEKGKWAKENFDLTSYAGKKLLFRFRADKERRNWLKRSGQTQMFDYLKPVFLLDNLKLSAVRSNSEEIYFESLHERYRLTVDKTFSSKDKDAKKEGISWQRMKFEKAKDLEGVNYVKPMNFIDQELYEKDQCQENNPKAYDDNGHGTHMAGTIIQRTNNSYGVASVAGKALNKIKIMPVKVLNAHGLGKCDVLATGIYYAAMSGADVINMSLSNKGGCKPVEEAVKYAIDKGSVLVAGCGNSGETTCRYPAAYENVISVGAVTSNKTKAAYSSYGDNLFITAPGGQFLSKESIDWSNPEKALKKAKQGILQQSFEVFPDQLSGILSQGTSSATAHVSGVVALLMSLYSELNQKMVKDILSCAAEDLGDKGKDRQYGVGLINAGKTLNWSQEASCLNFACLGCPETASTGQNVDFIGLAYSPITEAKMPEFTCKKWDNKELNDYAVPKDDNLAFNWKGLDNCGNNDKCKNSFSSEGTKKVLFETFLKDRDETKKAECSVEISDSKYKPYCSAFPGTAKIGEKLVFRGSIITNEGSASLEDIKERGEVFGIKWKDIQYSYTWTDKDSGTKRKTLDYERTYEKEGTYKVEFEITQNGKREISECGAVVGCEPAGFGYNQCSDGDLYSFIKYPDGKVERDKKVQDCDSVFVCSITCKNGEYKELRVPGKCVDGMGEQKYINSMGHWAYLCKQDEPDDNRKECPFWNQEICAWDNSFCGMQDQPYDYRCGPHCERLNLPTSAAECSNLCS